MDLTRALVQEYTDLYASMVITSPSFAQGELQPCELSNYQGYGSIPPYFLAAIHYREGSFDLGTWLCNGDSLQARTVDVPAGRIPGVEPPYTWEQGVQDTITQNGWEKITTWDIPTMLFLAENFNGDGYRSHGINSPYLWAGTNHYSSGYYGSDDNYDPNLVNKQIGVAICFKMLMPVVVPIVAPPPVSVVYKYGDTDSATNGMISKIQQALISDGFLDIDSPTGNFLSLTQKSVKNFQKKHKLAQDGQVGPQTLKALGL